NLDGVGQHRRHQALFALHEGLLPQAREELTREKRIGLEDRRSVLLEWLLSNFTHREFHPSWNYLRVLDAPNAEAIRRPPRKSPVFKERRLLCCTATESGVRR